MDLDDGCVLPMAFLISYLVLKILSFFTNLEFYVFYLFAGLVVLTYIYYELF